MPLATYPQSILHYFSSMDIASLRLYLKDEYPYQATTKAIFLREIEDLFNDLKKAGDTHLAIYKGACGSDGSRCPNCGVKGYRFVGNNSRNYFDLLFEMEGDDISDIYYCEEFKPDEEISELGTRGYISIDKDEEVTFYKSPEYWDKVFAAMNAYSDIIKTPPMMLQYEELNFWIDKHAELNKRIGGYNIFKPSMKWTPFSRIYSEFKEITDYIAKHHSEITKANKEIKQIETEQDLINWLLNYETAYKDGTTEMMFFTKKDGENYCFDITNLILYKGEVFNETFGFFNFYQSNNEDLLSKYCTFSSDEESELYNNQDFSKNEIDIFSLRFHLEKRNEFESLGIIIPYNLKNKKNKYDFKRS